MIKNIFNWSFIFRKINIKKCEKCFLKSLNQMNPKWCVQCVGDEAAECLVWSVVCGGWLCEQIDEWSETLLCEPKGHTRKSTWNSFLILIVKTLFFQFSNKGWALKRRLKTFVDKFAIKYKPYFILFYFIFLLISWQPFFLTSV